MRAVEDISSASHNKLIHCAARRKSFYALFYVFFVYAQQPRALDGTSRVIGLKRTERAHLIVGAVVYKPAVINFICFVCEFAAPEIQFFIIPALWRQILSKVSPRYWVCSKEIEVITASTFSFTAFVASKSPPMPHSITAYSHPSL